MPDNVTLCRERLLCGRKDLQPVVERNIVCADGLEYDYSFNGETRTVAEKQEDHINSLFDFS